MESSPASRMTRQVFCFSLRYLQLFHAHSRAQLVSQSFGFISTAIRSGAYCDIFEAPDTIRGLIAGVAVPDLALRTRDVEAFEDTSFEYVRAELHVSEIATPWQAALDVFKVLGGIGSDSESVMTSVVLEWIRGAIMGAAGRRGRVEKQGCGGVLMRRYFPSFYSWLTFHSKLSIFRYATP